MPDFADFNLAQVTLLRPLWLAAAIAALALFWLIGRRGGEAGAWARAADAPLLAAMAARGGLTVGARRRGWAALIVAVICALALAGPALERTGVAELRNIDALLIVADLSDREASEAEMTRLRFQLRQVADSAGTRQTGLIVFAGDAYLASAFSSDPEVTGGAIAALEADTVPTPGAAPARALTLALQTLRSAGVASADVVLASRAAGPPDEAALAAAVALKDAGYRLHMPRAAPDAALLAELAARPVLRWRAGALAGLAWQDYGRWLLALAALASFALFRRRAA